MGHFSVEITDLPGSLLNDNQHTGLKKTGYTLTSEKVDGVRRYRIVEAAA